jgi:hypothetical protein
MFEQKIRNNFWGRHRFPSHEDGSVSQEIKLTTLRKLGYVNNEMVKFDSWIESVSGFDNRTVDVAPGSVITTYQPSKIPWLQEQTLTIELFTTWYEDRPASRIPPLPGVSYSNFIVFPKDGYGNWDWQKFHGTINKAFEKIESNLMESGYFFPEDSFHLFDSNDPHWYWKGRRVNFSRIRFGNGDYWGTLWYYV